MPVSRSLSQHTIQSFGDISRFLREGVADEDSRQMRDSVAALAQCIDEALKARRERGEAPAVTHHAQELAKSVRDHQRFITGLGSAWHSLYEFGAYQNALRALRRAAEAWLKALEHRSAREAVNFDQLELLAWRTLGEGVLLIDMYEQGDSPLSGFSESTPPGKASPWAQVLAWWQRLRR